MALRSNVTMVFTDYQVTDTGVQLHFVCTNPGGGEPTDYFVFVTDAEVATIATLASAKILVAGKLARKLRATGLATKLDQLIGESITGV